MHPDLERERFIDHIAKLEQENARLRMDIDSAPRLQRRIEALLIEIDRLKSADRPAVHVRPVLTHPTTLRSCRLPGCGLGRLTFDQVEALHEQGAESPSIAQAAGVRLATVSRWRRANGYVRIRNGQWRAIEIKRDSEMVPRQGALA